MSEGTVTGPRATTQQSLPCALVTGSSAWTGPDLLKRPEEWTYRLSHDEIAEIEAAAASVRGRDIATIGRSDFRLPTLGSVLERLRDEVLNGRGFVLIRGLPVENRPIAGAAAYWGIGTYFGNARSQNASGHVLGHVRDLGLSSKDPNVRIYQTTERQNFHTDSCDIVALLCLKTAKSGGLSSLTSSMTVYNAMATRRPDLVWRLFQPMPTDRRGEVPEGKRPWFDTPIYSITRACCRRSTRRTMCGRRSAFPRRRGSAPRTSPRSTRSMRWPRTPSCGSTWSSAPATCSSCTTTRCCTTARRSRTGRSRSASGICCGCGLPHRARARCRRPMPTRYGSVEVGNRGGIVCKGTRLHAPLEAV